MQRHRALALAVVEAGLHEAGVDLTLGRVESKAFLWLSCFSFCFSRFFGPGRFAKKPKLWLTSKAPGEEEYLPAAEVETSDQVIHEVLVLVCDELVSAVPRGYCAPLHWQIPTFRTLRAKQGGSLHEARF